MLTQQGCLYFILPQKLVVWRVKRAIPLGSTMSEARTLASRKGWREKSGSLSCTPPATNSSAIKVELGYSWYGLPAVAYTWAELCFDSDKDQLKAITILYPIDAI